MPAGVAASFVLLRVLGVTNIDLSTLGLPLLGLGPRLVLLALVLVVFAIRARARGRASRRAIVATILAAVVFAGWDELHWSYVVVAAAALTVLYAAAVSLALPEQWEVARHDVTLATLWIAFAVGTPIALAAGLFILVGAAFAALLESVWMPPHRAYIGIMSTSVWTVAGIIGLLTGAASAADTITAIAAVLVIMVVLILELAHAGRRLAQGEAPPDLDIAAGIAALLSTALLASLLSLPIPDALALVGRPLVRSIRPRTRVGRRRDDSRHRGPHAAPASARFRGARRSGFSVSWGPPTRSRRSTLFRALERAVTMVSGLRNFSSSARRRVLAAVLIVALLVWSRVMYRARHRSRSRRSRRMDHGSCATRRSRCSAYRLRRTL